MPPEPAAGQVPQETVTCDSCERREPAGPATMSWTISVERGRRRAYCDTCSRRHLRAMEGKLDREFW